MAGYKLKDSKEVSKCNSKYLLFSTSACNDVLTDEKKMGHRMSD